MNLCWSNMNRSSRCFTYGVKRHNNRTFSVLMSCAPCSYLGDAAAHIYVSKSCNLLRKEVNGWRSSAGKHDTTESTKTASQQRSSRFRLSPTEDTLAHLTAVSNISIMVVNSRELAMFVMEWWPSRPISNRRFLRLLCLRSRNRDVNSSSVEHFILRSVHCSQCKVTSLQNR